MLYAQHGPREVHSCDVCTRVALRERARDQASAAAGIQDMLGCQPYQIEPLQHP